jgi:glycine cleavage system aminomethyltransferase T
LAFQLSPSARVRRSPFHDSTVADGVVSFTTYNRMLMPTGYGDPIGEYWRLINDVAMWDVAVERQIEICGPDAARLVQILTPRKLGKLKPGVG